MSTRLQVIFDDEELEAIKAAARAQRVTVAEWVRQALRRARLEQPATSIDTKLRVIHESARYGYASGDIGQLLDETARGRGMGTPSGEP